MRRAYVDGGDSPSILLLLNIIFGLEECPTRWCRAIAWPVYKSGSKHRASNYRLITLLSAVSKLLERILYTRINTPEIDLLEILIQRSWVGLLYRQYLAT